jgi:hypothetical protein
MGILKNPPLLAAEAACMDIAEVNPWRDASDGNIAEGERA